MKLLQNRLVVGLLAAVALAMLVNALWPVLNRSSSRRSRPKVTSAPVHPAVPALPFNPPQNSAPLQWLAALAEKLVATATNQRAVAQQQSLDVSALQNASARWVASPRRDPFQMRRGFGGESYPPAMELLKLTAVWRQTGGALATINGRVLTEGDPVLKFKIEKIEATVSGCKDRTGANSWSSLDRALLGPTPRRRFPSPWTLM
jgi:hypothetical protein